MPSRPATSDLPRISALRHRTDSSWLNNRSNLHRNFFKTVNECTLAFKGSRDLQDAIRLGLVAKVDHLGVPSLNLVAIFSRDINRHPRSITGEVDSNWSGSDRVVFGGRYFDGSRADDDRVVVGGNN
jgi:hypothetical protein